MSQGAEISQPSDSVHLRAPAHYDDWREDMGRERVGMGVWGEMEFKSHEGSMKEKGIRCSY